VTRRKPRQITTGRLQSLRLFSTLLAIPLIDAATEVLSTKAWSQQLLVEKWHNDVRGTS
jgi:hypothetical protein